MMIGLFYLAVLASVPLAAGRLGALADLRLRRAGLAVAAILMQIVIISLLPAGSHDLHRAVHVGSYLLLGAFAWFNRRIAGLPVVALGGALNFLCISVNGGVMPADPDALEYIGRAHSSDEFINSTALADPKLAFLGDIIPTPASWPVTNVYSVGDLLILTGAFVLLHVACGSRIVPRRFRREPVPAAVGA